MLPVPTVADLVVFSGRVAQSYGDFVTEALRQATLLFSIITTRTELPEDPDGRQLAINAILQMADSIYLEQPNAAIRATPFQSETIGSYSYSKAAIQSVKAGQGGVVGLFWWDLALDELSLRDRSLVSFGAIEVFDRDHMYVDTEGNRRVLGPADFSYPGGSYGSFTELTTDPFPGP